MRPLLDEDTQARRLVLLLRAHGHDILTVGETGQAGAPDPEVVRIAVTAERVLLTRNCGVYLALHRESPDHRGILCVFQDADPAKSMSWQDICLAPWDRRRPAGWRARGPRSQNGDASVIFDPSLVHRAGACG